MTIARNPKQEKIADVIQLNSAQKGDAGHGGLTDGQLVKGVLEGEPTIIDAFVDRFGPVISKRVWKILGPDSEHEDMVQQIFAQIFITLGKLEKPGALIQWVNQISVNVVRKELRRRSYRRIVRFSTEDVELSEDGTNSDRRLQATRALAVLNRMKPEHRIVFAMRFIEGCELTEIADAMDCSLATVKRKVTKARNSFFKKAGRDSVLAPLVSG